MPSQREAKFDWSLQIRPVTTSGQSEAVGPLLGLAARELDSACAGVYDLTYFPPWMACSTAGRDSADSRHSGNLGEQSAMARKLKNTSLQKNGQVSAQRSARFFKLLMLLRDGDRSREELARRLRVDMRGFYRDLRMLRQLGVRIASRGHGYQLNQTFEAAIARVPFPDPQLNLHEALQLSIGRTPAHRKLRAQIRKIAGPLPRHGK